MRNEIAMGNGLMLLPLMPGCLYALKLEGEAQAFHRFESWDYINRGDNASYVWVARFKTVNGITVLLDEDMVLGNIVANNLIQELGPMGRR
jgi:heme exporter protein D